MVDMCDCVATDEALIKGQTEGSCMKFDLDTAWKDTMGLLSRNFGLLAVLAIQHRIVGHYWLPLKQLRGACMMLVLMALWFYPMSMGSSYTDPYALGFGNFQFSTALLLLGLLAWVLRAYATCLILVSAQLAFGADLLVSDNLWDYLIDPWLVLWAAGWLIRDRLLQARAMPAPETPAASSQSSSAAKAEDLSAGQ